MDPPPYQESSLSQPIHSDVSQEPPPYSTSNTFLIQESNNKNEKLSCEAGVIHYIAKTDTLVGISLMYNIPVF